MNTKEIKDLCEKLDLARKHLEKCISARSLLNLGSHQEKVTVSIGSLRIEATETDINYRERTKRGCEMIILGAIKLAESAIESAKNEVLNAEKNLIEATKG